jgi:hypothetical protein
VRSMPAERSGPFSSCEVPMGCSLISFVIGCGGERV